MQAISDGLVNGVGVAYRSIGFCSTLVGLGEAASLGGVLSFSYNFRCKDNYFYVSFKKSFRLFIVGVFMWV